MKLPGDLEAWTYRIPTTPAEAILAPENRIAVHQAWADYTVAGSDDAKRCADAWVGAPASHLAYIAQYRAMIEILRSTRRIPMPRQSTTTRRISSPGGLSISFIASAARASMRSPTP